MENEVKNTRVYENVVEHIKKLIINGQLKIGDKLPTERAMAEKLDVSRASVREALRSLQVIGLIESRQGAGNYIKKDFDEILLEPLSIMFMLKKGTPLDIYELREVLELSTIMLSAQRIKDEELEELRIIVDKLKEDKIEDDNVELDKNFHYTIVKAADNSLLTNLINVLSELIDIFIKNSRKNILECKENREKLIALHEEIYKALKNRDGYSAYMATRKHFELIKAYVNK